ncbi:hypothetical protein KUTeg_021609, partial [Tegillarca granosa]
MTLIGCLVYLVITIHSEIINYLNHPTTTSIDIDVVETLNFPAVTICNLSPSNRSKMKLDNEKALNYYTAMFNIHYRSEGVNWSDPYYEENGYFEPESVEYMMNNISMELDEFIQFCMFNNLFQRCSDIFKPRFTSFGSCYVFNHDGQMKTGMKGERYNLILEIIIDQKNYFYGLSHGSGIKHKYLPYPYKAFRNGYCLDTKDKSFINPLKYSQNYSVN